MAGVSLAVCKSKGAMACGVDLEFPFAFPSAIVERDLFKENTGFLRNNFSNSIVKLN